MCAQIFLSQPQCPGKPMMSEAEIACFSRWIPKGGKALEFGMGGSTRFFLEQGIWHLTSVESDPEWVQAMRQDPFLQFFLRKERLSLNHADIGPVQALGTPLARHPQRIWLRYHQDIWKTLTARDLDIILVDGRFRVACACQALLRCRDGIPIVFHDFWNREYYHGILDYADVLDSAETMAVLREKPDSDKRRLLAFSQRFRFTPE